ncbi:MAG: threonine synthase [Bacillota bacterium]
MYISTRGNYPPVPASAAIKLGMVPSGGLFVPEGVPTIPLEGLQEIVNSSYLELAEIILGLYLNDFVPGEISHLVEQAYQEAGYGSKEVAPLYRLNSQLHILELWHGPTAAFKDVALQLLPHLLVKAIEKTRTEKETVILVATSGDTGKAALEGFKNVAGTKIIVFYPQGGVSPVQELQMTTTDGNNTYVIAVKGNFDDCQTEVKKIFGDEQYKKILGESGYELSSANSINWGRLLPQIVYYFHAYLALARERKISLGEVINFVVPTGNFGNILAGWYAKAMGLPVGKLICASNENNVLTDFFNSGIYDRRRRFHTTISPSMDILISSNLERFLFEMNGRVGAEVAQWMDELQLKGVFKIDKKTKTGITNNLWAGFATEEATLAAIKTVFEETGYSLDPHTAVGMKVYWDYQKETKDTNKAVLLATASPFKFASSVLKGIEGVRAAEDEFAALEDLSQKTGLPIHQGLVGLREKRIYHREVAAKEELPEIIKKILKLS